MGNFHPFVHPRDEHTLLFSRMEGQTENFIPRGQNSPLGDNFTHGGQSLSLGVKLRMGLWGQFFKQSCRLGSKMTRAPPLRRHELAPRLEVGAYASLKKTRLWTFFRVQPLLPTMVRAVGWAPSTHSSRNRSHETPFRAKSFRTHFSSSIFGRMTDTYKFICVIWTIILDA
jgi:hypothetical protein